MATVQEFYEKHRGGQGAVVLACGSHKTEGCVYGIFSTIELANAWADEFDDEWEFAFAPYLVDVPEYGYVSIN